MATIKRHPELPDYFESNPATLTAAPSIAQQYEAGKVIAFPQLRMDIDFDFWASLPSDDDEALRKLKIGGEHGSIVRWPDRLPGSLRVDLERHIRRIYEQLMPAYLGLFSPYRFIKRQGVLRLNRLVAMSMHLDSYGIEYPTHHARLFVNLDSQPRIWHTSHSVEAAFELARNRFDRDEMVSLPPAEWWSELRFRAFGGRDPSECWDAQPRHVCVFDPGDVWAVDSRQVAHQVFYGRRALTIDFTVDVSSMLDPGRHYLAIARKLRESAL